MDKKELYKDKNWLIMQYWGFNLTMKEIGNLSNTSRFKVSYWMKEYNIPIKSKSQYGKEKWSNSDFKQKMKDIHKKRCNTKEFHKRRSKEQKQLWNDIEYKKMQKEVRVNSWKNNTKRKENLKYLLNRPDVIEKRSKKIKETYNKPEYKKLMSEISTKTWQNPKLREKIIRASVKVTGANKSKLEKYVDIVLDKLYSNEWIHNKQPFKIINGKVPDFYHISLPIVIEVNGDFWHSKWKTGVSKDVHEQQQIDHYKKYGYDCLVFWEYEVNGMNFENLLVERLGQLYLKFEKDNELTKGNTTTIGDWI